MWTPRWGCFSCVHLCCLSHILATRFSITLLLIYMSNVIYVVCVGVAVWGLHGVFCLTYGCVCVHLCTPGSLRPACGLGGWRRLPQSVSVYSLEVPTGD